MRALVLAACVLLAMDGAALAETPVQRFVCVFDRHVSPDTVGLSSKSPLNHEFMVDGTGSAFAVGKNVYPVKVVMGSEGVTFLEELRTGVVQSTTIHRSGKAVHSRHAILFGKFVPSQYYGTCEYRTGPAR